MESEYYKLGLSIAAAARGDTVDEILQKKASTDTVANHKESGYGAVQRLVCKYAAEAYKECGKMDSFSYHVFNKLASTKNWWPELDPYYDAASVALGKVHSNIRKEAADANCAAIFEKRALNLFTSLATGATRMSPELIKMMLGVGAVGGVGVGSAAWLANRGITQDQPQIEAMKEKINYYNQLTEEIEGELKRKGSPTDRDEVEEIVNEYI